MDITNPDQPILIGPWRDIVAIYKFMRTLKQLKLADNRWHASQVSPNYVKKNYVYITNERITFESKRQLILFMKNNKSHIVGLLYAR